MPAIQSAKYEFLDLNNYAIHNLNSGHYLLLANYENDMSVLGQLIKNSKINKKFLAVKRNWIGDLYDTKNPWFFFITQIKGGEFNRFDVVVRYMAVESIVESTGNGLDLYEKMQKARDPNGVGSDDYVGSFRILVESFKANGFDFKQPIICNKNNELIDGAHRLACALYFDVEKIKIKRSEVTECAYGLDWFEEHFSLTEINAIKSKFESLLKPINLESLLHENLSSVDQQFGRGDLYQSCDELNITGQRPTQERFQIYGLSSLLKSTHEVLDIGCNCGFMALEVAKSVKHVDGLEFNRTLVEIGRATQTCLGRNNCNLIEGDFNKFSTEKNYDVIFSFAVHHWVGGDISAYGQKLFGLLKPDGLVVFESQNLDTVDKDFEEKTNKICAEGFEIVEEGKLKDDGVIERKFKVLKKVF